VEARHYEIEGGDDAHGKKRMNAPGPKTMSSEARRLQALLNLNEADGFLQMLVGLGSGSDFSIDLPVNLATNGCLVRGKLTNPEDYAQVLDAYMSRVVAAAAFRYRNLNDEQTRDQAQNEDATRKTIAAELTDAFSKRVKRRRALEDLGRRLVEEAWGDPSQWSDDFVPRLDDLSDDNFENALGALSPDIVVTLREAEILPSGSSQWTPVGYVRVLARHVSAWWLSPAETSA
jgi:hypothetical protein